VPQVLRAEAAVDGAGVNRAAKDPTILLPRAQQRSAASRTRSTGALSSELLGRSASRLGTLSLLYAFTFFMAAFFPSLISPVDRAMLFADSAHWVPALASIAVALMVWAFTMSAAVPVSVVMNVGLAFEVVSSYGIAIAEYIEPMRLDMGGWLGLSWVAVWTLLFGVVIPTKPARALLVTLASVSAPPVVIGFMVATRRTTFNPDALQFFFWVVFPYLLVTLMAYVGARVIYSLGRAVTEARELGSYRLVERLGGGGMGEVWRARHHLLARPAAIKVIRPITGGSSEDAVRRFEREAQVTAGLTSPHTVQLFDFGIADDGGFYYVMELLDGLDLQSLVERFGPVPPERAIYLVRQVCHSLAEAESYGLVHRDIKPANLFLCRYGGEHDFLKVLDFGIVKQAEDVMQTGALGLTRDNMLHGTPGYIAPEQALGSAPVDRRADIYATGCVAYYLLTGAPVFTGDTPMAVVVHHAHTPPSPPSERATTPIPAALDQLVMACLAKDPAERPQSARELSRRLADIPDVTPWTEERAHEWWETHQGAAAAR
jgi:serine/threonine-protein kinase